LQGHADVPLSDEGIEQAHRLAARLAGERVDAVWSSDLSRARTTAGIIAAPHGVEVTATPQLRETMLGEWEGLTKEEIVRRGDEALLRAYRLDPMNYRPPGAETLEQVWKRLLGVLAEIRSAHASGTVVVAGHGGSLRVFLCEALGAPVAAMRRIWLDNASLSLIEYDEDRVWVRLMNDTGHLNG
jgi:broad specificity phosphatase PhoE